MLGQEQGKLLGTFDAMLFRQQIDGVLLRIGGHDVRVVALIVILFAVQLQVSAHLEFLDGVHGSVAADMQHLDRILAVSVIGNLVLIRLTMLIHAGGILWGLVVSRSWLSEGRGKHCDCNHSHFDTDDAINFLAAFYIRTPG